MRHTPLLLFMTVWSRVGYEHSVNNITYKEKRNEWRPLEGRSAICLAWNPGYRRSRGKKARSTGWGSINGAFQYQLKRSVVNSDNNKKYRKFLEEEGLGSKFALPWCVGGEWQRWRGRNLYLETRSSRGDPGLQEDRCQLTEMKLAVYPHRNI